MSYGHYSNECHEHHDLVVDFGCEVGATRPRIVVLCGSTRFRDEFTETNRRLTLEGAIVLGPGCFSHCGDPVTEGDKVRLDELHRRKIDLADEVFVVNPRTPDHPCGYIGDSTRSEIAYAETLGKPISYLTPREDTSDA